MDRCLVSMAILYRNWRASLVRDYLNKGKNPRDEYKINPQEWEVFKKEKSTPEFLVRNIKKL